MQHEGVVAESKLELKSVVELNRHDFLEGLRSSVYLFNNQIYFNNICKIKRKGKRKKEGLLVAREEKGDTVLYSSTNSAGMVLS